MSSYPGRAVDSGALRGVLAERYGLSGDAASRDLGGFNLNLLVDGELVVRVYYPWVSGARVTAIQRARAALQEACLPFATTVSTLEGEGWATVAGRVVEVERYIAGGENMDLDSGLETGLPLLGRIHGVLAGQDLGEAAADAPHANHVASGEALMWAERGNAAIRRCDPSVEAHRTAERGEALARELAEVEAELPSQLVHGDFWDNNVLFHDGKVVLILDLDFMGIRPRVDDLALTLYYTNSTLGTGYLSADRQARLAKLVDAYDTGLATHLSAAERNALPFALARTILFMFKHIARMEDADRVRREVGTIHADVEWSLALLDEAAQWRTAFA